MDTTAFDRLARLIGARHPRRPLLRSLAAATLGLATSGTPPLDAKKRKKKRKKLKKNAYGCVNVGGRCRGRNSACCSGICQGKKPKKGQKDKSKCLAHNVLDCPAGADVCEGPVINCGGNGTCFRTTGQASFCGTTGPCVACQTDADCEEAFYGEDSACVVCEDCTTPGRTACIPPAFAA